MQTALHEDEKQQFLSLLHQLRIGEIDDRMALAGAFFNSEEHHTAIGWRKFMQRQGLSFDLDFITQNLELLARFGMAYKREFENEPTRYEHHHLGEHHDHMICTSCGKITEFMNPELERLQEKSVLDYGFRPLRHRLQIYGLCSECLAKRPSLQPLSAVASGEKVRVEKLPKGERALAPPGIHGHQQGRRVECAFSGQRTHRRGGKGYASGPGQGRIRQDHGERGFLNHGLFLYQLNNVTAEMPITAVGVFQRPPLLGPRFVSLRYLS